MRTVKFDEEGKDILTMEFEGNYRRKPATFEPRSTSPAKSLKVKAESFGNLCTTKLTDRRSTTSPISEATTLNPLAH